MRIPKILGLIDRRILVNYRIDPHVLRRFLPVPFEPLLVGGVGMAGICLIRLKHVRTRFWPARLGLSSENAAHRIAVWWQQGGQRREGVYIPRRDTSSRLSALVGGRVFPGEHHLATFDVHEEADRFDVRLRSRDGRTCVEVAGRVCDRLPADSAFDDLSEASEFFARGSLGYSATQRFGVYDGLELRTAAWRVEALDVERVRSSFFEDESIFPPGSTQFDCALLMRGIEHQWHARQPLCCSAGVAVGT
jgi:hypothetical protein